MFRGRSLRFHWIKGYDTFENSVRDFKSPWFLTWFLISKLWFLISKLISDFQVDFWFPNWFLISELISYFEKLLPPTRYKLLSDLSTHTVWPWDTRFRGSSHGLTVKSYFLTVSLDLSRLTHGIELYPTARLNQILMNTHTK